MSTLLDLINDLEAEQAALREVLERLSPADWDTPTHGPGWAVRDQVSHLAFFDEAASRAITAPEAFAAEARAALQMAPAGVLDWWRTASATLITAARTADPKARLPWYGPDMSASSFITARLMETWSHGLDVVDVVDGDRPDSDRLRHVAFLG